MGANSSRDSKRSRSTETSQVTELIPSQVNEFHSYEEWKAHFEASKGTTKLMVIEFGTTWCGYCAKIEPAMKKFAADYTDVVFIKIDADELPDVARKFSVNGYPTFILMKKGKKVDQVDGADEEDLRKKIEKHRV